MAVRDLVIELEKAVAQRDAHGIRLTQADETFRCELLILGIRDRAGKRPRTYHTLPLRVPVAELEDVVGTLSRDGITVVVEGAHPLVERLAKRKPAR